MDLDGNANNADPCPDVWGTGGLPAGEFCSTIGPGFGATCDTNIGKCDPVGGCSKHTGACDLDTGSGTFGDCLLGPYGPLGLTLGFPCTSDLDCSIGADFTTPCTVDSDCFCDFDRDLDGVIDAADNCVLTPNGPAQAGISGVGNQTNADGDLLGDACDTDCTGSVLTGRCRNSGVDSTGAVINCPPLGFAFGWSQCDPGRHPDLPQADWDLGAVCVPYTEHPRDGSSTCSSREDDRDIDGIEDGIDNCPVAYNPSIIAGTDVQTDRDRDGLGDACDPAESLDDANNGIPDDVVHFGGSLQCRWPTLQLASLEILEARYMDLDGDGDPFPDTGETGRIELDIRNTGATLTDAIILLQTEDEDVLCISEAAVVVGTIAALETITVGSLSAGPPGFTFTAAGAGVLEFLGPPQEPETIEMNITAISNEAFGIGAPTGFELRADVDAPPGLVQVFTAGPDGISGNADDGVFSESFDIDRDGSGVFNVASRLVNRLAVFAGDERRQLVEMVFEEIL